MLRVARNRSKVGKAWLVQSGRFRHNPNPWHGQMLRWHTDVVLSEHNTKAEAKQVLQEYLGREKP